MSRTAHTALAVASPAEREEVDDVAAAAIDRVRLPLSAVHGLHVGEQQRLGEPLPEDRHDVADALIFEQRRAELEDGHPRLERCFRHCEPLRT